MSGNVDSTRVVLKCAIIAGCVCMTLFRLSRTRRRPRWANRAFVAAGLIGITAETLSLMMLMGWLSLSLPAREAIDRVLHYTYGLLLLIIFALIVSGQLRGTKRSRDDETRKPDT